MQQTLVGQRQDRNRSSDKVLAVQDSLTMLVSERDRLFALIGALEEDLRDLIDTYLLSTADEEAVLGPAYERARDRLLGDSDATHESEILDYLDLGDEVGILLRWHSNLPGDTAQTLKSVAADLNHVAAIRNRVMHRRPLLTDDTSRVEALVLRLEGDHFLAPTLLKTMSRLRIDPAWAPTSPRTEQPRVLNNLPLAEFDETGLVGRQKEIAKLTKLVNDLDKSRSPVISVIGPGGVGKTALVVQVLHDLVNDPECPFDLVSWVSLKTEYLTANGVASIRDAVLSVEHAIPALAQSLDSTFEGNTAALAAALEGVRTLVVIDNLETVSGQEVLDLIDSLPQEVSYLFTSREGLGQLERRFQLEPLDQRSSVDLLRRLCRARGLDHLARMKQDEAATLVDRLHRTPLALRWFVLSAESGRDPNSIADDQVDLLRFCVENVFESLEPQDRQVAHVLYAVQRPLTAQEIQLLLPDVPTDSLRRAVQNLSRRMLLIRDTVGGSLIETFQSSDMLEAFIQDVDRPPEAEIQRVRDAEGASRAAQERHRQDAARDPLRPTVIQGGPEHSASVVMLRDALSLSKRRNTEQALEILAKAEELDPHFWEISRVRGFILSSSGDVNAANSAYERAIELAQDEQARAAVSYFYAGHLSRNARQPERAVQYARVAHDLLREDRTAFELARALTFVADYDQAEQLLRTAYDAEFARTRMMVRTALLDTLTRRAEDQSKLDRNIAGATQTLREGIRISQETLEQGLSDHRFYDQAVKVATELLSVASTAPRVEDHDQAIEECLDFIQKAGDRARSTKRFQYLQSHGRRLIDRSPELADAIPSLRVLLAEQEGEGARSESEPGETNRKVGSLKAWRADKHFGFAYNLTQTEEFFFHLADLIQPSEQIFLIVGAQLEYRPVLDDHGRLKAERIRVVDCDMAGLVRRKLTVARVHDSGRYLFALDDATGATVFVGQHATVGGLTWQRCAAGDRLLADLQVTADGRFAATWADFTAVGLEMP